MNTAKSILLSTVTDVFFIEGHGCVVVPGVPDPSAMIPVLRHGAPITLRIPDGSEIESQICDFEMVNRGRLIPFPPFSLQPPLSKANVPIGTEIWYFPTPKDTYVPGKGA